jgi:hypothetical protein
LRIGNGYIRYRYATRPGPRNGHRRGGKTIEIIGDAEKVADIYSAVHAGYAMALK